MEFRSHTLENDLEIVAECNAAAYSTAVGFFVKAGSRDETDPVAGVSHFLEHMAFKGTPTRSVDDVNREFDEMGAANNASTGEEYTIYHAAVLPEYQNPAVRLLADILRPSLRDEDFQTEKQVIVEEIHMYEDQPPFGADEKARALFFGLHPLGRSVLGTVDSIEALSVDAMRDYFNRRYSPENITLVGTGKIDFKAFVDVAHQACGDWRPHSSAASGTGRETKPCEGNEIFQIEHKEASTQEYTIELSAGPAVSDSDRFAAKLLATVIGDDSGSRFYWEMIDPGYADQASLCHCEFEGAGVMMTYMSCDPGEAADNLRRIRDIFAHIESHGVSEAELQQAKNKVRSRIVISSERPRGRLFPVGADWLGRREYNTMQKDLDDVAALTLDDLAAVVKKYPLTRCTTLSVGPLQNIAEPTG